MKYSLLWHLILSMWPFHHLCCNHCLLFKAITYDFGVELDQTYPGNRQLRLSHTCLGVQIDRFLKCQLQMAKYLFHTLSAGLCSRLPSQLASILTGQFRYFTSHNTTWLKPPPQKKKNKKIQRIFFFAISEIVVTCFIWQFLDAQASLAQKLQNATGREGKF